MFNATLKKTMQKGETQTRKKAVTIIDLIVTALRSLVGKKKIDKNGNNIRIRRQKVMVMMGGVNFIIKTSNI